MLDHQQGVAFVAQVVHDAHEPADIARMQTDARLVHNKKRIDQRRAETGGEIDALNFAAAQSAGGTIEGEITDADFAKITQARANFVAQHLRGGVIRCDVDLRQKIARIRNGKRREIRQAQRFFPDDDFDNSALRVENVRRCTSDKSCKRGSG